jgi:hypothetical protein
VIADGESPRHAELPEVVHTTHIATCKWEELWEEGGNKHALKEHLMYLIFFGALACTVKGGMKKALR